MAVFAGRKATSLGKGASKDQVQ